MLLDEALPMYAWYAEVVLRYIDVVATVMPTGVMALGISQAMLPELPSNAASATRTSQSCSRKLPIAFTINEEIPSLI